MIILLQIKQVDVHANIGDRISVIVDGYNGVSRTLYDTTVTDNLSFKYLIVFVFVDEEYKALGDNISFCLTSNIPEELSTAKKLADLTYDQIESIGKTCNYEIKWT